MQYRDINNTQSTLQNKSLALDFKMLFFSILKQTDTTPIRVLCPFVLGCKQTPQRLSKLNPDLNWFWPDGKGIAALLQRETVG